MGQFTHVYTCVCVCVCVYVFIYAELSLGHPGHMRRAEVRITQEFYESIPQRGNSVVLETYKSKPLSAREKFIKLEILYITQ